MAYDVATGKHVTADYSCGIGGDDDMGSFVFTEADQNRVFSKIDLAQQKMNNKIDDVRYDVRRASSIVGAAVGALAGAMAMVGIAHMLNAIKHGARS